VFADLNNVPDKSIEPAAVDFHSLAWLQIFFGFAYDIADFTSLKIFRERRVMVEPAPASAFVVVETNLLFQVLKVALDAPAQLGGLDELSQRRVCRQRREPVFVWSLFGLRPFDQQPFFRPWFGTPGIAMRWPYA
jgi:hypothetical protein